MPTEPPTAESVDAGAPAAQAKLKESLGDASVLLWFATREGKEVGDGVLRDIVNAQSKLKEGAPDPRVEGSFWMAYRDLAKAVRPASVDSILATHTDAAATKKKYSRRLIRVFLLLLAVQIFWFIGTAWRTDLETHRAELDRIAGNLREMMLEVKAAHDLETHLVKTKEQPASTQQDATQDVYFLNGNEDVHATIEKGLQILVERQDRTVLLYANATLRGDRVEKMLQGNYKMLKFWDFVTNVVEWFGAAEPGAASGNGPQTGRASDTPSRTVGAYLSSGSNGAPATGRASNTEAVTAICSDDDVNEFYQVLCDKANAFEKQQLGVEDVLVNSASILAVLSQYLLPLLYGWIGSLAYILRTLSSEIQNVTFTRSSEIRYSLRWPLGMLGGVTVGLFFDPGDFSGFAAITPLGLAFLAGYGVELLFAGLDRMVSAFTGEGTERPRTV